MKHLALIGSVVGWAGVLVCGVSGLVKLLGSYYFLGMETQTIFIVGIGLIATGILAKLEGSQHAS